MLRTYLSVFLCAMLITACSAEKPYQSHAEDVFPAVPITRVALFRLDTLGVTPEFFRQQWTAVVFGNADCGQACQQLRAVSDALQQGQALMVIEDLASHEQMRVLKQRYPNVEIGMGVTAASIDNFKTQFEDDGLSWDELREHVHLVNPQGVLSYRIPSAALPSVDIDRELKALP